MNIKPDYYHDLRTVYRPDDTKLIIIAESPPAASDPSRARYIYDPAGRVTEPLFAAFMRQLGVSPKKKAEGLQVMKDRGWMLVDATYQQVNKLGKKQRNEVIESEYPLLKRDLCSLMGERDIPLIVIKVNVCDLLCDRLCKDGFRVLNKGARIPFPSNGNQTRFREAFEPLVKALV